MNGCDFPTRQTGSNLCVCGVRMELHDAVHNREHIEWPEDLKQWCTDSVADHRAKRDATLVEDAAKWRALGLPDDCDPAEVKAMLIAAAEMVFAMHESGVDIPPKRLALARHIEEQQ